MVHEAKIREIKEFMQRLQEAELLRNYGPAFAESYNYEDKLQVAHILKMIRRLHKYGNDI